jgi:P-aminobenzoate N-oxygenase AurF
MDSLANIWNQSESEQGDNDSIFQSWCEQASTKTKPRRIISEDELEDKVFFPPDLFPVVLHPLIEERGKDFIKRLLIHRLYTYLDFTDNLELQVVNPIVCKIAYNQLNIDISCEKRLEAYAIYVDEAYHALFSVDIKIQVEKTTGIASPQIAPIFLQRLVQIQEPFDNDVKELIKLFSTIISETLITGILTDIPRNKSVVAPVRKMVLDHAQDESRHHLYFASLLEIVWFQLSPKHRSIIGSILPQIIFAFLEPDIPATKCCLRLVGLESQEIDAVVKDSYPQKEVIIGIRKAANVTLKHLRKNGIFEDPCTEEVFWKSGLFN